MEQQINNLRGKYIKRVLSKLETLRALSPQERKIILDAFNDLIRDIQLVLAEKGL